MKKLLAIVMVAVMVLSMSVVAFAEEEDTATPDYTVSATAQANEDGTVTVVVSAKGNIEAIDVGVVYEDTEPVEVNDNPNNKFVKHDLGDFTFSNVRHLDGMDCVQLTGAVVGKTEYDGVVGTFTFTKAGKFKIATDIASEPVVVIEDVPVAEYVAPTEAPTPVPTPTPPVEESQNPTPTPGTPANGPTNTPASNGSNNAAKTADVAPVAAMVTLVLMAGAVLVVLKKRAAE